MDLSLLIKKLIKKLSCMGNIFRLCAGLSTVITISVFVFMLILGLPLFRDTSVLSLWAGPWAPQEKLYGIGPMIAGTIGIAGFATLLALPLSLGSAFVITTLGHPGLRTGLKAFIRFMTGIPTVIYGFSAIFLLVPLIREGLGGAGFCVLAAGSVLAVLVTPVMTLFFVDSLLGVNPVHIQAARALGASRIQRLLYVMIPQALPGLATGFVLATGRAIGDTLIALMLAGNAIIIPETLLDPARTLTGHIALIKAADYDSLEFRSIFACGIALYLFSAFSVIIVRIFEKKQRPAI